MNLVFYFGLEWAIYIIKFIETLTVELPQLNEELIKGYDRLRAGFTTKQFIGYMYFSKNNIRYLIGIESTKLLLKLKGL